ncbi:unnamed protein product, partial [Prorocentrum cordatum]
MHLQNLLAGGIAFALTVFLEGDTAPQVVQKPGWDLGFEVSGALLALLPGGPPAAPGAALRPLGPGATPLQESVPSLFACARDMLRGAAPPPPDMPPPPEPEAPKRLLAPASERDPHAGTPPRRHRISPSTSFLMLKLTKEQAARVMSTVNLQLLGRDPGEIGDQEAEEACSAQLKELGIRTTSGGGAWTSIERSGSPLQVRAPAKAKAADGAPPPPPEDGGLGALPDVDGLLGPGLGALLPKVAGEGEEDTDVAENSGAEGSKQPKVGRLRTHAKAEVGADLMDAAGGARVFVKNLDKSTGERELRELFGKHGTVTEVKIPREKDRDEGW